MENEEHPKRWPIARVARYALAALVLLLMAAHVLRWSKVDVDGVTLALLGILVVLPYVGQLSEIGIPGVLTAKIRPEEIKEVKDNIPGTPRAEEAAPNKRTSEGPSEDELDSFERRYEFFLNMVKNDSQVGLANLRGALQLSLEALYRALLQKADGRKNHSGWPQMLNALSDQKIIPVALTASLRDIMRLTNRAAHGEHIARDDALDLARLAVGLLKELDFIYHEKAVRPLESKVISRDELEKFESSKYRVTTVVPLVEDPKVQVYVLDQYGLNQLLYGYEESAEFLVSIEQINGTPCASLGVTRVAQ